MTRALLFDVMDTLVADPFFEVMPRFFGLGFRDMLAQKHPTAWLEFERGERTEAEFLADFFLDQRAFDHAAFLEAITEAYELLPGVHELLGALRARGVPLYAFSNYPLWYRRIEQKLRLSRFLEWRFVSCETGLRKPDRQAYEHVLSSLGVPPSACLLVDDREVNCDAARSVGMDTIRFEGAAPLAEALDARGLLPASG